MKIGIQGLEGSYHHQVANQFFGDKVEIAPFENFRQVFEALDTGMIDKAVVGIENSLYGSINDTYDLLLQYKPTIIGEVYLHVRLDLLANEGVEITDITDVYSQAPALAEAKLYLREHVPAATLHEYPDTAMSARFVAKQQKTSSASIASEMAGKLYGLEPLAEGIEDHHHNYTRFVVITKKPETVIDADKTSVIVQVKHDPGALYGALGVFANNNINLSKIESRPIVDNHGWHYIFYMDFEAGVTDNVAKTALASLDEHADDVTILGSYVRSRLPNGVR